MTAVGTIDREAEGAIRTAVKKAPGDILRTVAGTVKEAAKKKGKKKGLTRLLKRLEFSEPNAEGVGIRTEGPRPRLGCR